MKAEHKDLVAQLRDLLGTTTPMERAELLDELARTVYDHVKFRAPEGGGIDLRDGPEREALADVVNATSAHADDLRAQLMRERDAATPPKLVQRLVDAMLDRAAAEQPGVEFTVFASTHDMADLPKHADKLLRTEEGRRGYYAGHVYRDTLVVALLPEDTLVVELIPLLDGTPAAATAPTYVGELTTGQITIRPVEHSDT